jgi:hypothetical protein
MNNKRKMKKKKKELSIRAGGVAQVIEHLPSKQEAPIKPQYYSLHPPPPKKPLQNNEKHYQYSQMQ